MAARAARQLAEADDLQVETVAGGIGEFSVFVDGQEIIDTNRVVSATFQTWSPVKSDHGSFAECDQRITHPFSAVL